MIKISFLGGSDQRLVAALKAKGPLIIQTLVTKLTALMFGLQRYIVAQELSGQILKRRTGILSGSIRAIPAEINGNKILGEVVGGGGPAFYGAIQEFGGTAPYTVIATNARALAFITGGKLVFAKSVQHPAAIARPFMSLALDANAEDIETQLRQVLAEELARP